MNVMVEGSDHRAISCDTECARDPLVARLRPLQQESQPECVVKRIRRTDLVNKNTQRVVEQEFKEGYPKVEMY